MTWYYLWKHETCAPDSDPNQQGYSLNPFMMSSALEGMSKLFLPQRGRWNGDKAFRRVEKAKRLVAERSVNNPIWRLRKFRWRHILTLAFSSNRTGRKALTLFEHCLSLSLSLSLSLAHPFTYTHTHTHAHTHKSRICGLVVRITPAYDTPPTTLVYHVTIQVRIAIIQTTGMIYLFTYISTVPQDLCYVKISPPWNGKLQCLINNVSRAVLAYSTPDNL